MLFRINSVLKDKAGVAGGLVAKWRGSALARPLLDALLSSLDAKILCALHRGDSFINPDKTAIIHVLRHTNGMALDSKE